MPILGVHGDPVQYELAKVPITLNDMSIEETVAIAPEEQMNTRVLLSVSLNQEETSSLATKAMARKGTQITPNPSATVQMALVRKQPTRLVKQTTHNDCPDSDSDSDISDGEDRASDSSFSPHETLSSSSEEDDTLFFVDDSHNVNSTPTDSPALTPEITELSEPSLIQADTPNLPDFGTADNITDTKQALR